ncbi:MAG: N-6 DNA methylase [Candidatus Heimdallarchaeota archaeon]
MINSRRSNLTNLHEIEKKIEKLEAFLINCEFQKSDYYKDWYKDYLRIYGNKFTNLRLYIISAIFYFMGYLFLIKFISNKCKDFNSEDIDIAKLNEIQTIVKNEFIDQKLFTIDYYNPFLNIFPEDNVNYLIEIFSFLLENIQNSNVTPEFTFDYLIQKFLSPLVRHKSGEFFTPPFLVKEMIKYAYKFGEKVLDPSCGSGNFLIGIIKKILSTNNTIEEKISAINNIYGYDINPLLIFLAKLSFLYLLKQYLRKIKLNLYVIDSLFHNHMDLGTKFDLIIGNPPWYTLRDIDSANYQSMIKLLAEELEIKPAPKNVLNIEISALFFYKAKKYFMRNNAKIFFVITKGVITGSHASRFRNFEGFTDIKIWLFNKKIEKIFNIDFICLYAQKSENFKGEINYEIPTSVFSLKKNSESLNYFDNISLVVENSIILVPYSIERKGNHILTNKLISKEEKEKLLPIRMSYYNDLFHKGADLNPRNLIFISFKNETNGLVKINPDIRVFKRAKSPWNKKVFKDEIIEKRYLFKAVKSTELIKFLVYDYYYVFLPIERETLNFNYSIMGKFAKRFYDKINNIYLDNKKSTTDNASLMDNLDRWSKLRNSRQLSNIKIVYNNSGSTLNSAVVEGDFLVTGDLTFLDTNNLNEAFYLCAILNSRLMNRQIRIKKSSRHIFKIPFETPISRYDNSLKYHRELAQLAKEGQFISNQTINNLKKKEDILPSKMIIQKSLKEKLNPILIQIDKILEKEFS